MHNNLGGFDAASSPMAIPLNRLPHQYDLHIKAFAIAREVERLLTAAPAVARAAPVASIKSAVADACGVTLSVLDSRDRTQQCAHARHVVMFILRKYKPKMSLPAIGKAMSRHHTTVLCGTRRVERLLEESDTQTAKTINVSLMKLVRAFEQKSGANRG